MTDRLQRSLDDLLEVALLPATGSETQLRFSRLVDYADRSMEFEGGLTPTAAVLKTYERRARRLSAGPIEAATAQLLHRLRGYDGRQVIGFAGRLGIVDFVVFLADDESEMVGCIVSDARVRGE